MSFCGLFQCFHAVTGTANAVHSVGKKDFFQVRLHFQYITDHHFLCNFFHSSLPPYAAFVSKSCVFAQPGYVYGAGRSASVLGVELEEGAAHQLSLRSRGTPRIANRLLRRVRDWAIVHDLESVDVDAVTQALALYQIDSEGLDRLDIAVLQAICRNFNGGPVGLNNLSAMVGEESETVETVCEPYLVREGFLVRTPKGRVATAKAWRHLGLEPQDDVNKLF